MVNCVRPIPVVSNMAISTYAELFSLIFSIALFRKLSAGIRAFSFLLFFIVAVEVASELKITNWHRNNNWIYNLSTTVEFLFYSRLYYNEFKTSGIKNLILYLTVVLLFTTAINIIFVQGFWKFHSYTFMIGSILMILYAIFYFYSGLNKDINYNYVRDPVFWISVSLLQFYAGEFMIMMFYSYLAPLRLLAYSRFFRVLMDIINVLEYGLFCIAFIVDARQAKIDAAYSIKKR